MRRLASVIRIPLPFTLDPTSLIFTNAVVLAVVTVMLLVARIGMGRSSDGVRTWVAADLALGAARGFAVAELINPDFGPRFGFLVVPGSLVMIGLLLHIHALRRVLGKPETIPRVVLQCAGLALLFGWLAASMPSISHRASLMNGLIFVMAAITLHTVWPLRRHRGARIIGATMLLALLFQGVRLGSLLLGSPLWGGHLDDARPHVDVEPLTVDLVVALFVTAGFMLLMQELLRERIERLVVTDALTGTLNRHGLVPPFIRELTNAERYDRPLSVVMFDLDHFKRVNDVHGHAMGDTVLAGFAARATALMRGGDMIGRWGGEEFLLVLPDTTASDAKVVAERIREGVAKEPVAQGAPLVTVSGGIASFLEVRDRTQAMLEMLEMADRRLYIAKKQRNLVVSSGGEPLREAEAAGVEVERPSAEAAP